MVRTPNQRSAGNNPNAPKKGRMIRGCKTGGKVLLSKFNKESDSNYQDYLRNFENVRLTSNGNRLWHISSLCETL